MGTEEVWLGLEADELKPTDEVRRRCSMEYDKMSIQHSKGRQGAIPVQA